MQTIKHAKTSAVPDGSDPSQVQPSDWNADHTITGSVAWTEVSGKPSTFPPTTPIPYGSISGTPALASTTEVLTGTNAAKTVTPDALAALYEYGGAVSAASVVTLGEGGHFLLNSAGTIDNLEFATKRDGRRVLINCNTNLIVFKHLGTAIAAGKMNLPGNVDFTGSAGDVLEFVQAFTNQMYCISIRKTNGSLIPTGLASTTEVLTGTDAAKAVTPDALAALWEQATAIPVAATIPITEGGSVAVTGTGTDITAFSWTPSKNGRSVLVRFGSGGFQLINSASLVLPGGADISVAGGDWGLFLQFGSATHCAFYQRAAVPVPFMATTTDVLTGTNATRTVTPDALAALWERGADLATAANLVIGDGGQFILAGAGTITDIDFATPQNGRMAWIICNNSGIVFQHSATLNVPGSADYTSVTGDRVLVGQWNSDNVYIFDIQRGNGKAVTPPAFSEVTAKPTTLAGYGITDGLSVIGQQVLLASGTYTPTAGMKYCVVEGVGGAGAGGSVALSGVGAQNGASGGGGGEYCRSIFPAATIGASKAVVIGAAGAPGAAGANNGGAGGNTTFGGTLLIANGGAGGIGAAAANVGYTVLGGFGGTGQLKVSGGSSQRGTRASITTVLLGNIGGDGGGSILGIAGKGAYNGSGTVGQGYGAGGGGAGDFANTAAAAGAAGTAGVIIVTEFG